MLVKPYAVFLFIPFIYWVIANHGFGSLQKTHVLHAPVIAIIPLLLWRHHASLTLKVFFTLPGF